MPDDSPAARAARLPEAVFAVVFVLLFVFLASRTPADPDLPGHVLFGRDIIAAASIPSNDGYSFTSDRPWVNHEWLAEVLMAAAYGAWGNLGLVALKCVVALATALLVWWGLARVGVRLPLRIGLFSIACIGSVQQLATVRPQLFSLLFFVALTLLLGETFPKKWRLVLLPLLFAVWANLHGGWIVGLGTVAAWSAARMLNREPLVTDDRSGRLSYIWLITPALAALGSLATPYGAGLWRFLADTVGLGRAGIEDWQPIFFTPQHLLPWGVAVALLVAFWRRQGWRRSSVLLPSLLLGLLALRVDRIGPFFVLCAVAQCAPAFAGVGPLRFPLSKAPTRWELAVVSAVLLAGCLAVGRVAVAEIDCIPLGSPSLRTQWAPEPEAASFFTRNRLRGHVLTWFNYGEYAIWHLAPALKVSYDGRRETVYSQAVQAAHQAFYESRSDASYARKIGADYVWLPRSAPVLEPLEKDGWRRLFDGRESVILARTGITSPAPPASFTGPRCFPGP